MPTLARRDAIETLTQAVQGMNADDILDFHNELFPRERKSELDPGEGATVRKKIMEYFGRGLEVEEILDLWPVAFPGAWDVSYDDETDTIHFSNEPKSVYHVE